MYLGRRYSNSFGEFNTGGAGYLLNKHALKALVSKLF
jgi:hypothetical protein